MDQKQAIEVAKEYAKVVVNNIEHVNKVVLYGSYARGTMHRWSDIDIAVIVDFIDGEDIIAAHSKLFRLTDGLDDRIEPMLLIDEDDPSDFLPNVLKTGKIIYDVTKRIGA